MTSAIILVSAAIFLLLLERLTPRIGPRPGMGMRWFANAMLGGIGYGIGRFAVGAGLLGLAHWASANDLGVFPALDWPLWLEAVLAIVALDFALWAQHALFHHLAVLWPLHRVHHSDQALDVTTAWRFHPGETLLSLGVKAAVILALGIPLEVVAVFELILVMSAMFNHAHLRLPNWLDRCLSIAIVTPDMHRVHHGREGRLDHTNFGFFLNIWDKVFRCYKRVDPAMADALPLGTPDVPDDRSIIALLLQPFRPR
jgi:sterol desaturase/sphingolipid hydroxylase (fatty acid hydroxylase superfamily)